jgi:hypothetical protein
VILPGCRALYWSSGADWTLLEAGPGLGWRLRGSVPDRAAGLLTAEGWTLRIERAGTGRARLAYVADGRRRAGPAFPIRAGQDVDLEVVLDPVHGRITADAGGRPALTAWLVDVGGEPEPRRGWEVTRSTAALCEELSARLHR